MNLNKFSHWRFLLSFLLIFAVYNSSFNIIIAQKKPEPVITMSSSSGWGPFYSVEIDEDGTAIFYGRGHGILNGKRKYKIPRTQVAELIAEFDRLNFFSLNDSYPSGFDDGGSTTISFSDNGKRKTVTNEIVLKEFDELASKIRDVADVERFYDAMYLIKVQIDASFTELNNDSAAKTRLIITMNGTAREIAKAERRIKDHIKFRGYDMKRVKLVRRISKRKINMDYKIISDTE